MVARIGDQNSNHGKEDGTNSANEKHDRRIGAP